MTTVSAGSSEAVVLTAGAGTANVAAPARQLEAAADAAWVRRRPAALAVAPLTAGLVAAAAVAAVSGAPVTLVAVTLACWLGSLPGVREGLRRLDRGDLDVVGRRAVSTFALLALAIAVTDQPTDLMLDAAVTLVAASAALAGVVLVLARVAPARVLVVGEPGVVAATVTRWPSRAGAQVVGALLVGTGVDDERAYDALGALRCARDVTALPDLVRQWSVDCVAVVPSAAFGPVHVGALAWRLERSRVRLVVCTPVLDAVSRRRLALGRLADTAFVRVASSRVPPLVAVGKAVLDRVLAVVLLVLLAPLLVLLGTLVRLDSPGPALFRQTRLGRDGRLFTMYKLRTMVVDAEEAREALTDADQGNGVLFKIHDDPRVTRFGGVLRRLSLDEVPQLLNVVLGHMSLVGPRPALPSEAASYDDLARRRLVVRPGITGLWQVRGRSDLDWERSIALDAQYADNVALASDLMICLATVRAVLSRRGAY